MPGREASQSTSTVYIRHVQRNQHLLDGYIALDVIPGVERRREWHPDKIEQAAQRSFDNWQTMRRSGLNATPVYHMDERFTHLQRYLDNGANCVALSPHRGDRIAIRQWVSMCFQMLQRYPRVKAHGLAMTSTTICLAFPWSSTDSSRYALAGGSDDPCSPLS